MSGQQVELTAGGFRVFDRPLRRCIELPGEALRRAVESDFAVQALFGRARHDECAESLMIGLCRGRTAGFGPLDEKAVTVGAALPAPVNRYLPGPVRQGPILRGVRGELMKHHAELLRCGR